MRIHCHKCGAVNPEPLNPSQDGISAETAKACWDALARYKAVADLRNPAVQANRLPAVSAEIAGLLGMILRGEKVETESTPPITDAAATPRGTDAHSLLRGAPTC